MATTITQVFPTRESIGDFTSPSQYNYELAPSTITIGALQYTTDEAKTLNLNTTGLGGLDTGSLAFNNVYKVFAVAVSNEVYLVASLADTPAGYDAYTDFGIAISIDAGGQDTILEAGGGNIIVEGGGAGDPDVNTVFIDTIDNSNIADYTITGSATFTEAEAEVLNGIKSLKLDHQTAVSAKRTIDIANKFKNQSVRFEFDINSNATSGNITLTIVDETNTVTIISADSIEPFNGTGSQKRRFWFDIPETCDSLSFQFDGLAEASAITFIDDIKIEKEFQQSATTTTDELLKINEFSAVFSGSLGTSVGVLRQSQGGTFSVSYTSPGVYVVDYSSLGLSEKPSLTGSVDREIANSTSIHIDEATITNTQCTVEILSGGTFVDKDFHLFLQRQGADYDANLIRRVETKDTFSEIVALEDRDISEVNEYSAVISNNGTATITSKNADWIDSITRTGAGVTQIDISSLGLTVAPKVQTEIFLALTFNETITVTPSLITVTTYNDSGVPADLNYSIDISRQGSDVYNKTLKRIKTNPNQKVKIPSSEMRLEGAGPSGTGLESRTATFSSLVKSRGNDLLLDNSNGTIITCKKDGLLAVSATASESSSGTFWLTKNQADNTANPLESEVLTGSGASASETHSLSGTFAVKAGDKIRITTNNGANAGWNTFELYFQEQEIQVGVSNILPKFSESDACISVYGQNGNGSTNTVIPRLSSFAVNNPNGAISYTDTAADGNAFEILEDGTYNISWGCKASGTTYSNIGISLNSSNLTTAIQSLTAPESLGHDTTSNINGYGAGRSIERTFSKGDIIRLHGTGITYADLMITISKVGKPNITSVDVTPFVTDYPLVTRQSAEKGTPSGVGTVIGALDKMTGSEYFSYDEVTGIYKVIKNCQMNLTIFGIDSSDTYLSIFRNGLRVAGDRNEADSTRYANAAFTCESVVGDEFYFSIGGTALNEFRACVNALGTGSEIVTQDQSNASDWIDAGPIQVTSTAGAITKGGVTVDRMLCKRDGQGMRVRIEYKHTSAGASPIGDYIFDLSNCLQALGATGFDMTYITPYTDVIGGGQPYPANGFGSFMYHDTGSSGSGNAVVYDSTKVRFAAHNFSDEGIISSNLASFTQGILTYTADFTIPVQGWSSESKYIAAITKNIVESGFYHTHAGGASSGQYCPYYTTQVKDDSGRLVQVTNDSVNGFTITAKQKCMVSMSVAANQSGNGSAGISLNGDITQSVLAAANVGKRLTIQYGLDNATCATSVVDIVMEPGDVLHPHRQQINAFTANYNSVTFTAKSYRNDQ